jgi:predicted AAA+ superfamily ATPase
MKRLIDHFLREWKNGSERKPLLLRGARQVGKTHAVRELGKSFSNFVEINLETNREARNIFEKDLNIERIVRQLSELLDTDLEPGTTLLFLDEVQQVPQTVIALRYFYELMPDLHVIAAGSFLDFAIEKVGAPVGRITQLYMYPLSFFEFLVALGHERWAKAIISQPPIFEQLHEKLIEIVCMYLAIGGMPAAVNAWRKNSISREVKKAHADLLNTYVQDFDTYARKRQIKYLSLVFNSATEQLSRKFMYSRIDDYRKRELEPAIELLEKAGIINRVYKNDGQGIPIGAGVDLSDFKIIFLDVGLTKALLRYDISTWLLNPLETFVNKGELVEAFVGQELLAYSDPIDRSKLYYWRNVQGDKSAEVDYLIQSRNEIVPIEVKAGGSVRLVSMHRFLESHSRSTHGIRFWTEQESAENAIHSYPLYSIAKPLLEHNEYLKEALESLVR